MDTKKIEPFKIKINTDSKKKNPFFAPPEPIDMEIGEKELKKSYIDPTPEIKGVEDLDKTFRDQDESMKNLYQEQRNNVYGTYTMIPNSLLDILPKYNFTRTAHRLMWLIIRKTIGFHKDDTPISIDYMRKCTGITSKTNVIKGLKQIEEAGLVSSYYDENTKNKHVVLNKEIFDEFKSISKKKDAVTKQDRSRNRTSPKSSLVTKQDPVLNHDGVIKSEDVVTKNQDVVTKRGPNKETLKEIKEIFLSYENTNGISSFFLRKRDLSKNIIEKQLIKEFEEYKNLNQSHTDQEIEALLDYIETNGGVGAQYEGKPISFPFKYLNSGGLDAVSKRISKQKKEKEKRSKQLNKDQENHKENMSRELKQKQYKYFQLKYPEESKQTKILENIIKTELDNAVKKKLKGNETALRVAAKEHWIEINFSNEKYQNILNEQ
jgi:hypothetical protein